MQRSYITLIYSRTEDLVTARQISKILLNVISDFDYKRWDDNFSCPTVSFYAESPSTDELEAFENRLDKLGVEYHLFDE